MATIQKVSGIDFANISKFDGVDISAVGSINFIGKPATGNLLLDTSYGSGAEAAYSVRKLRTAYTGAAIQVQATTGGATAEIGFDVDNNLDTATLLAFAGTNEVGVSIWYDQSTNGNNATQISVAQRPIVVAAGGALVEDNGKMALDFDGSNDGFYSSGVSLTDSMDVFILSHKESTSRQAWFAFDATENINYYRQEGGTVTPRIYASFNQGLFNFNFLSPNYQTQILNNLSGTNGAQEVFFDGVSVHTASVTFSNPGLSGLHLGIQSNGANEFNGKYQEFILYDTVKSSTNRTSIESNIGDYYTQNQAPYLLDTYTGAAAAYSLRKLRTDYTGFAIKVQDNVGGATQDIGFDVFGELDTVSLLQYAGSNDVFVETWYDQSGSGNNATQPTSTSRPQIVSSGAVIVENGKPAIKFLEQSWPYLTASGFGTGNTRFVSYVAKMDAEPSVGSRYSMPWIFMESPISTLGDYLQLYIPNITNSVLLNFATNSLDVSSTSATNVQRLISVNKNAASSEMWFDGTSQGTGSGTQNMADGLSIGRFESYGQGIMSFQEMIIYDSDQSGTPQAGIETNINTFYDIYTPTPDPLLLNLYPGSAAAYSLRKLNANYTGSAILVQDTVGGATKAIGFDANGDLDTAELLAYAGSNDVLVATWFDQSGSGNNATQGSSGARPKIVSSGTVIVDANGKPTVQFNGSKSIGIGNYSSLTEGELFTTVRWLGDTSTRGGFKISTNGFDMHFPYYGGLVYDNFGSTSRYVFTPSITLNQINLYNTLSKSSEWTARLNSNVEYTSATNTVGFSSGQIGSWTMNHNFSEFILYNAVQSTANRTDIETNIGGYYDIPLAGLLDENPGAAAAYSLRRLSSTYTGSAIQVQRADNVGGTHNIGFDSYGELDTTALTTAAQGNDMVVATWYDQSGNSNDATQGTSANRPKIYDGTTGVVTRSGKNSIDFTGAYSLRSLTGSMTQPNTTFSVVDFISGKLIDASTRRRNYEVQGGGNIALWAGASPYTATTAGGYSGTSNLQIISTILDGSNTEHKLNNNTAETCAAASTSSTGFYFGGQNGQLNGSMYISEFVAYESDQSTNVDDIHTNQNTFYDIY